MLYRGFLLTLFILTITGFQAHAENVDFEVVAEFPAETPPGNIAIGPDNRIFLSIHEFYGKSLRVAELMKDGSLKPYPNNDWAFAAQEKDGGGLYGVLGLNVDQNGVLWMLDTSGEDRAGRLVGWDTKAEKLRRIIYLSKPVIADNSFLNDLAIDLKNNAIYIADTGLAAIIVVDLNTGQARRVLTGAPQTSAEDIDMVIDNNVVMLGEAPARLGINPITIDPKNEYVYFGAMTGKAIHRVKTSDLLNHELTDAALIKRVERYGEKPISDGITIDGGGNVYITSITDDSIGITKADGTYETLIERDDLSWPDGFAYGADHKVYVTINELHRSPVLNDGQDRSKGEFKIIRFDALAKGAQGR